MFWKKVIFVCILLNVALTQVPQVPQKPSVKLYKTLGLDHDDFQKIVCAHQNLKKHLILYFQKTCGCNYYMKKLRRSYLYYAARWFKVTLEYIEDKYLSEINNIILGNDNTIVGDDNVVQGDSLEIYGDGNYVFHDQYNDIPIIGGNIVRIGKYDVDLDKVQLIKSNPLKAIRILDPSQVCQCYFKYIKPVQSDVSNQPSLKKVQTRDVYDQSNGRGVQYAQCY